MRTLINLAPWESRWKLPKSLATLDILDFLIKHSDLSCVQDADDAQASKSQLDGGGCSSHSRRPGDSGSAMPIGNLELSHEHQEASKGVSQVRVFDFS